MRNLSLVAFASFLALWGISNYLDTKNPSIKRMQDQTLTSVPTNAPKKKSVLSRSNKRELDKIGDVINEQNVQIDSSTKEKITLAKKEYTMKNDLRDTEKMLEQGFSDQHSSIQDIKSLQNKIVDQKNKLKLEVKNTEKWEPSFIYYLMINENYSYNDVNQIQSLTENGFNTEELNYISELMRSKGFYEKIAEFKGQGEMKRKIASVNTKEMKDEYLDNGMNDAVSVEEKLIEMNYSNQQK